MKRVFLCIVCLGCCLALRAQETDTLPAAEADTLPAAEVPVPQQVSAEAALWEQANAAYVEGDFRQAAAAYSALVEAGWGSEKLYYNLANACFKESRLGEAILYYRRALRLSPGNEDIRYNLSVAEARTKDTIQQIPELFLVTWLRAVRHTMGCTGWSILSLVLLACGLGWALLYLLAQRLALRKTGFYGTLASLLLFVVATAFAAGERREMRDESQAVVMTASMSVKSSPDHAATDLFVLHEGTVVEITNRMAAWCEIAIADGKKGWVEARKIEVI